MKVLLVEDNPEIVESLRLIFELRWPEAKIAATHEGGQAIMMTESESPDVVILDLGLPDTDGFKVLKEIRKFSDVPVIILTVRGDEIDKVRGLELGADDYMVKPFGHMELLARVKAVLRRSHIPELKDSEPPLVAPGLSIDFSGHSVSKGDAKIKLTPTEFNLLQYLARNEGKVLSHRTLLEKIWGEEYTDATEYLKVYIQRLRDKLEDNPSTPTLFLSERGVGYKFVKPV